MSTDLTEAVEAVVATLFKRSPYLNADQNDANREQWADLARRILDIAGPIIRCQVADIIRSIHTPVSIVFSWNKGLVEYPPCPTCYGKAGVHECGCWADEDLTYECRECTGREGKRRVVEYPCPTIRALEDIDV